MTKRKNTKG